MSYYNQGQQQHRPQPNDGKKYCQRCLDLNPPAYIEIQLMDIPGQTWPNGQPKRKPVQPGTNIGHVHDPRIPAYMPRQQQYQQQPQQPYQQQPQPPVITPQQQPNYQNPNYAAQPSTVNYDTNTAIKECPICKGAGVPNQMILSRQEGFDPGINQAIWGHYDYNAQFPNQPGQRHVHKGQVQQQPQQQPQIPAPPVYPNAPLAPIPGAQQQQTNVSEESWAKATEMEEMRRYRFAMKELADDNQQLLRAIIRLLDHKLSKVITGVQTLVGMQVLAKYGGDLDKLSPSDKVNYQNETSKVMAFFNEGSVITNGNYLNDPIIHNALFTYKEPPELKTADTLSPTYTKMQQPTVINNELTIEQAKAKILAEQQQEQVEEEEQQQMAEDVAKEPEQDYFKV